MNKILSELPLIENGYRRGYIDWKKTSNTITEHRVDILCSYP